MSVSRPVRARIYGGGPDPTLPSVIAVERPPMMAQEAPAARKRDMALPLMLAALAGSSLFDAESTFRGIKEGRLQEANPLMRPLVKAGRIPTYAALMAANVGLGLLAKKARKDKVSGWWLPLVLPTMTHTAAGILARRFPGRDR